MLKICPLILMLVSYFSCYAIPENSSLQNITDKDSTISFTQNNILTFTPLQLLVGELRLSLEKQTDENKYDIYGVGIMYYKSNDYLIPISSDYYYGINLFYGKKHFFNKHFYWSYLLFVKYEHDVDLLLGFWISDRYPSGFPSGSQIDQEVSYRNKYVLGTKLLFGFQNSTNHKIISNFYWGVGIRFKISDYSESIDKSEFPYITKGFIVPSIHLGYLIGYNFRRK